MISRSVTVTSTSSPPSTPPATPPITAAETGGAALEEGPSRKTRVLNDMVQPLANCILPVDSLGDS